LFYAQTFKSEMRVSERAKRTVKVILKVGAQKRPEHLRWWKSSQINCSRLATYTKDDGWWA